MSEYLRLPPDEQLSLLKVVSGLSGLSTQPAPGRTLLRQPFVLSCAKIEHEMNHIRAHELVVTLYPRRCLGLKAALALRAEIL